MVLDFCCTLHPCAGSFELSIAGQTKKFRFTAEDNTESVPCQIKKVESIEDDIPFDSIPGDPFVYFATYGDNLHLRDQEVERLKKVGRSQKLLLKLFSKCIRQMCTSHYYRNEHVAMLDGFKGPKFKQLFEIKKMFTVDVTDEEINELMS